VHDSTQRLDTISTTRAALKNGSAVILRAALFESNPSQTDEESTTAERSLAYAGHGYTLSGEADEEGSSMEYRGNAASVAADMRAEALRCARLVLQSLVNEVSCHLGLRCSCF